MCRMKVGMFIGLLRLGQTIKDANAESLHLVG